MEREGSESEAGNTSKTRKPSRNKLACNIACLDGVNFNINIEVCYVASFQFIRIAH